jgi:hypothetical protein
MGKTAGVFVFRRHVGGMSSSGLSHADFGKNEAIGGITRSVFLECWKDRVQSPAAVETLFLTILTEANVPVFFKHRLHGTARQTSGINPSASGWMPPSQSRCRGPSLAAAPRSPAMTGPSPESGPVLQLLDMGFRPAITKILACLPPKYTRQTFLFSATYARS